MKDKQSVKEFCNSCGLNYRYGMVWKNHQEEVVERCKTEIPTLKMINYRNIWQVDTIKQNTIFDTPHTCPHRLIEGDNYHALEALVYIYKGKINVIYIDPPYNTGNKDFLFNDVFVDKEDGDRHSKWQCFMEHRLILAQVLLSETGVMFISIDDNELDNLLKMCKGIFGEKNVKTMLWDKTGHGKKGGVGKAAAGKTDRSEHEHIVVCYKNRSLIKYNKVMELPNFINIKGNPDKDERGPWESGNISASNIYNKNSKKYYEVISPSTKKISRNWLITEEEFKSLENDNRIYWGKSGDAVPRKKIFVNEPRETLPGSIITNKGSLSYGKDELEEILGTRIDTFTPKPTLLIKYLIKIVSNKDAKILDFFAGSGTTGHAVLELNKEDGGSRQFILCTNNENKICTDICYPRLQKVIEGYKTPKGEVVEGIPANLVYFTCGRNKEGSSSFMPIERNTNPDTLKLQAAQYSTGIIRMIEGTYIEVEKSYLSGNSGDLEYIILRNGGKKQHGNKYVAIYYTIYGSKHEELCDRMNNLPDENTQKILYCDAFDSDSDNDDFKTLKNVKINPFPKRFFNAVIKREKELLIKDNQPNN